jgi:branched-chain amino acid transport system ATP-binding protein
MAGGLEITDLYVDRGGRTVLHGVSMSLEPGAISALLGANGAGKSTLVMTVGGALPAKSGGARLEGNELIGLRPHAIRRLGIAVVAEGHLVLTNLTVMDNLRAAGLLLPRPDAEHEVEAALAIFPELRERLSVNAQDLSGGQKQLVNIAQALIARPRFLLIDELSFGLAPAIVVRLGEVIKAIAARGVGVLLIEQFTTLALSLASRAYVMERGSLVFAGTSAELRAKPEVLHGAYLAAAAATTDAVGAR